MAQASNYFPSQGVELYYQKEAVVGTSPDDADLIKLQATSFTIPEASAPVEYSSQRSGSFVTQASQGHHGEGEHAGRGVCLPVREGEWKEEGDGGPQGQHHEEGGRSLLGVLPAGCRRESRDHL